jgi:hypothetical protein
MSTIDLVVKLDSRLCTRVRQPVPNQQWCVAVTATVVFRMHRQHSRYTSGSVTSRLLKKPLAKRCGVENRLEMLTYCRVRSAFDSVFALHRIHQRLFQQPARALATANFTSGERREGT